MRTLLLSLITVAALSGCKKPYCEEYGTGNFTVINKTATDIIVVVEPYAPKILEPGASYTYTDIPADIYELTAGNGTEMWYKMILVSECDNESLELVR